MELSDKKRNVLIEIWKRQCTTKKELADIFGVSIPKASALVDDLSKLGLLVHEDGSSSGGRKPKLLRIRRDLFYTLSIDVGNEWLRWGIADMEGCLLQQRYESYNIDTPRELPILKLYDNFISLCDKANISPEQVKGVGVGITGIVNESTGKCQSLRNTPDWKNFNVKNAIASQFGIKNVLVTDSVKAMTMAEQRYGGAAGLQDFIVFNIGIGLGAGIVINDQLLTGNRGTTGEIGHMHIRPSNELCVCGNTGCLEAMASGWALLKKTKNAIREGVETSISVSTNVDNLTVSEVVRAALGGDKLATVVLESAANDLAIGIGSIINILNPSKIILGGGLIRGAEKIMMEPLLRGTRGAVIPWLQENINLQVSELGEWDTVMGLSAMTTKMVLNLL